VPADLSEELSIEWNLVSPNEWREALQRAPKSNLLQTWGYAKAMRSQRQQMTRFGVIRCKGAPVGIVQVQEVRLFGFFHTVTLHRGPLWFEETPSIALWKAFFEVFDKIFPRRWGRIRRLMPELSKNALSKDLLSDLGFKSVSEGYRSIWIDLRPDLDAIRAGLKANWRNKLRSAEKSALVPARDESLASLSWFLSQYEADQAARKFRGPAVAFVRELIENADPDSVFLYRASIGQSPVAGILLLRHGSAATYQIGWTGDQGRKHRAHHLLLWRACEDLKARGVGWLDAGGINEDGAAGVTTFKRGLGGEEFELVGVYA
jgi:hypothetical protein